MATQSKSAVELFVQSFIRTHKRGSVKTKQIDTSISLIDLKLSKPEEHQLVIPISSIGIFTVATLAYLNIMSKFGNKQSLLRAKALLIAFKNS